METPNTTTEPESDASADCRPPACSELLQHADHFSRTSESMRQLIAALESANDLCRSAMAITQRNGGETNWHAFEKRLRESLDIQHKAMHPQNAPEHAPRENQ